ncbi:cupin domain-containing protein [Hymenobacter edaphi]|uniref:Cupin type-2 domain-containing protein n=1 Tax=Hymenobacter edaphi TaxID=2211146 RepID=A0A328BS79_9BACT|nr:cupin domain-containing protein [Hymenobacter edaphi]RAK69439.1 hypothetical protein DLM85_00805 [Hymenobacter edaphi]
MQRRSFLQLSALAPVATFPLPVWLRPLAGDLPGKSVLVRAGKDRSDQPFRFLDAWFTVKVSGRDTEGRCVIFDTLRQGTAGPALHYHKDCEEWFCVQTGTFRFQVGEETLLLQPGDSLLVPRGVNHAFVKTSPGDARLLLMHQPAGTMEEFFRTASKLADQRLEARIALAAQHDIHIVGQPLKPD